MIWVDQPYVTLMASLPAIRFLTEKEPPINRQRLMERLKDLPPADQETLRELTEVVSWRFVDTTQDDAAFLARAAALLERIASPTLAAAVRQRLELRTVIAALRRRHADGPDIGFEAFERLCNRLRRFRRDDAVAGPGLCQRHLEADHAIEIRLH